VEAGWVGEWKDYGAVDVGGHFLDNFFGEGFWSWMRRINFYSGGIVDGVAYGWKFRLERGVSLL
jgi:hypothetical protein